MISELDEIKNNFGDERKTDINDTRRGITNEDLIPEETRVLTYQEVDTLKLNHLMNIVSKGEVVKARQQPQ